ncbi:DUF4279 domain-containing protein [Hymenobacter edaphi]|nr:DUF4279 domain-containing protein [Hymenobacter edaphi]
MIETITKLIHQELLYPEWEMTKQLLAVMNVELDNGLPKIEAVVVNKEAGSAIGYVPVTEGFYIGVHLVIKEGAVEINAIDSEPSIHLSYSPISEDLSVEDLLCLTSLQPQQVQHADGATGSGYNSLWFESSARPGRIEEKLDEFLAYLEQDVAGIHRLIAHTGKADIWVSIGFHIANRNFTQLFLPQELIARLHQLGLALTFDLRMLGREITSNY